MFKACLNCVASFKARLKYCRSCGDRNSLWKCDVQIYRRTYGKGKTICLFLSTSWRRHKNIYSIYFFSILAQKMTKLKMWKMAKKKIIWELCSNHIHPLDHHITLTVPNIDHRMCIYVLHVIKVWDMNLLTNSSKSSSSTKQVSLLFGSFENNSWAKPHVYVYARASWSYKQWPGTVTSCIESNLDKFLNISHKNHITYEDVRNRTQEAIGKHDDILTIGEKRKLR